MIKNNVYFMLIALCLDSFGHTEKQLDKKV